MKNATREIPLLTESDKLRFFSKVSTTPTERGCLEWMTGKSKEGYGQFWLNGTTVKSHRVAYFLHHGVDPGELGVCHTCDRPSCCNPDHFFIGTDLDNHQDKASKGRSARGESQGSAKLAAADIPMIRADQRSQRKIAADYGVHYTVIGDIKRREFWKHIP